MNHQLGNPAPNRAVLGTLADRELDDDERENLYAKSSEMARFYSDMRDRLAPKANIHGAAV